MADNVHRKSHSKHLSDNNTTTSTTTTTTNKKLSNNPNVVHRTTSETIRIGVEPDVRLHQLSSNNVVIGGSTISQPSLSAGGGGGGTTTGANSLQSSNQNQCRKKTSSFQITSVTVGCRMSNDAGEDSNDDLDESHTEDNSVEHSRITDIDIETPSYSEDTFSKEDVFFNTSNAALGTAPVIPTSSQYGLAIVPSEGNNVNNSVNDNNINTLDISSVTDNNIINLLSSNAKQDTDIREVHSHRNERFKVVKIESTEPFKRGRWTCMDYLDHTSVNQPTAINSIKVSGPNEVCISYGFTDDGVKQSQTGTDKDNTNKTITVVDINGQIPHQEIIQSGTSAGNYTVGNNLAQQNPSQIQQQQQQNSAQINNQYFQPSQQQQIPQQGTAGAQGATLPSNLQPTHPNNLGQPQSMPQGSIPIITNTQNNTNVGNQQQNIAHTNKDDNYVTVPTQNQTQQQQQQQQQTGLTNQQNLCQTSVPVSGSHPPPAASPANNQTPSNLIVGNVPPPHHQQQQSLSGQVTEPIPGMQSVQTIHAVSQVSTGAQQQGGTNIHQGVTPVMTQGQMQAQSSPGSCQNVIGGIQQQPGTSAVTSFHHSDNEQDKNAAGTVAAVIAASQSADATLLESLAEVTQSNDEHHALEDNESMSGTSAVAIDNKIEQAMDLVKSHLMFAVREEVEVLKEKIAELMDRINQLEAENSILKSHATAEILSQLSSQSTSSKLPSQNNANTGNNGQ